MQILEFVQYLGIDGCCLTLLIPAFLSNISVILCLDLSAQVVIFCFSKNRCDRSADSMAGTDLTSSSEKSQIRIFCDKAFSRLKGSDRNLPQVQLHTNYHVN